MKKWTASPEEPLSSVEEKQLKKDVEWAKETFKNPPRPTPKDTQPKGDNK